MKLMVRISVFALVCAGAIASSFTPKAPAITPANASVVVAPSMVISSAMPVPNCNPGETCGIGGE